MSLFEVIYFYVAQRKVSFYQFSEMGDDAYSINKLLDSELFEVVFNKRCTKKSVFINSIRWVMLRT